VAQREDRRRFWAAIAQGGIVTLIEWLILGFGVGLSLSGVTPVLQSLLVIWGATALHQPNWPILNIIPPPSYPDHAEF
jgi:hypothetical protein